MKAKSFINTSLSDLALEISDWNSEEVFEVISTSYSDTFLANSAQNKDHQFTCLILYKDAKKELKVIESSIDKYHLTKGELFQMAQSMFFDGMTYEEFNNHKKHGGPEEVYRHSVPSSYLNTKFEGYIDEL